MTKKSSPGKPLKVMTVCGVGMGSSLILRTTAEKALKQLGVEADLEHVDVSSARSINADVIIGQALHTEEFEDAAPVVVTISDFTDVQALKKQLEEGLKAQGWLT
jgi:PTS system ascorbate-specific IIB component